MTLTRKQRTFLDALAVVGGGNGSDLAFLLGTTAQGVHRTAASLVRHGLIERDTSTGFVRYALSDAGRSIINERGM